MPSTSTHQHNSSFQAEPPYCYPSSLHPSSERAGTHLPSSSLDADGIRQPVEAEILRSREAGGCRKIFDERVLRLKEEAVEGLKGFYVADMHSMVEMEDLCSLYSGDMHSCSCNLHPPPSLPLPPHFSFFPNLTCLRRRLRFHQIQTIPCRHDVTRLFVEGLSLLLPPSSRLVQETQS
jgi:hypothetical protein